MEQKKEIMEQTVDTEERTETIIDLIISTKMSSRKVEEHQIKLGKNLEKRKRVIQIKKKAKNKSIIKVEKLHYN